MSANQPKQYRYRGGYIGIDQAAQKAGVSQHAIRYRLAKNGGDMELAIHGGKVKGENEAVSDAAKAEAEILDILDVLGADAILESTGTPFTRKAVEPPRPDPQDYAEAEAIAQLDDRRQLRYLNAAIRVLRALRKCAVLAEHNRELFATVENIAEELATARAAMYDKYVDWEAIAK